MRSLTTKSPGIKKSAQPSVPGRDGQSTELSIVVVFTTTRATLCAFQHARELADNLGAHIHVIAPQVVPYGLPLEYPPVDPAFVLRDFRTVAEKAGIPARIEVQLCRDRKVAIVQALSPRSLVLIGGRNRWWPTPESSLARALSRQGHHVIFVSQN